MARRYQPLSARQVEILRWVADGCPDGVWKDFTYKHTAYALAERGLVTVDRRRDSWSAQITAAGRHYLQHGTYPANERHTAPETPQRPKPKRRLPRSLRRHLQRYRRPTWSQNFRRLRRR